MSKGKTGVTKGLSAPVAWSLTLISPTAPGVKSMELAEVGEPVSTAAGRGFELFELDAGAGAFRPMM